MMWRTIDTVPKDKTKFLVYDDTCCYGVDIIVAEYDDEDDMIHVCWDGAVLDHVTRWMPIPKIKVI